MAFDVVPARSSLPETSTEHNMTTTARPDPDILIDGGPPKEPTKLIVPANPSPPETLMELDMTTTARPDPDTLVLPEEPPAPAPSSSSKQIKFDKFDFTSALQPMEHGRKLQPSLFRSPTPHSDGRKYGKAKRPRNWQGANMTEMPVEKARLIPQDVLVTRIANQEKDQSIELLKNEASGGLLMIRRDN